MSLSLTATAVTHFLRILQEAPDALGIRIGVQASGCAEYRYKIGIAHTIDPKKDICIKDQGVTLVVDEDSLAAITGTEIDYTSQGLSSMVVFHNPHAINACGCGESFSLKK